MNRTATVTLVLLAAATAAAPSALAAPKPITKTYPATATTPDPTNQTGDGYSVCAQNVPGSFHTEAFKAPGPGTLKVVLSRYLGDWDLLLMNEKRAEISASGSGDVNAPETAQIKLKKAGTVLIVACNWAGGPNGEVTYTFTPAARK